MERSNRDDWLELEKEQQPREEEPRVTHRRREEERTQNRVIDAMLATAVFGALLTPILMAQSDVLVGPQVSNVDRLVAELMASLRERPVVDDVDNVTWFERRGGVY